FGTWESQTATLPGETGVEERDVTSFMADLNQAFPALELTLKDVSLVHRGVVPAATRSGGSVALEGKDRIHDHATTGTEGLVSVAGTKYTTARAVAEGITDTLQWKLGQTVSPSRTATVPLPGGDVGDPTSAIAQARRDYDSMLPPDA